MGVVVGRLVVVVVVAVAVAVAVVSQRDSPVILLKTVVAM